MRGEIFASMGILSASRYGSFFCIAALLNGCGGSTIPAAAPASTDVLARRVIPDGRPSWMSPDAKKIPLLYVSDLGTGDVYIYAYRTGVLKGTLTGFNRPWGLCTDGVGNVYVTDNAAARIRKYAHGGTKPIAVLKDPGETPGGCAVDPTTGDLAIANVSTLASDPGNVVIFGKGRGRRTFKAPGISYYEYCGYDNAGNLFVDGQKNGALCLRGALRGQPCVYGHRAQRRNSFRRQRSVGWRARRRRRLRGGGNRRIRHRPERCNRGRVDAARRREFRRSVRNRRCEGRLARCKRCGRSLLELSGRWFADVGDKWFENAVGRYGELAALSERTSAPSSGSERSCCSTTRLGAGPFRRGYPRGRRRRRCRS